MAVRFFDFDDVAACSYGLSCKLNKQMKQMIDDSQEPAQICRLQTRKFQPRRTSFLSIHANNAPLNDKPPEKPQDPAKDDEVAVEEPNPDEKPEKVEGVNCNFESYVVASKQDTLHTLPLKQNNKESTQWNKWDEYYLPEDSLMINGISQKSCS